MRVKPGSWVWEDGIGFRKHKSGKGGTWYIRYRVPVGDMMGGGVRQKTRSIEERVPN